MKPLRIVTSWDDGCDEDFRMAELLKQYDLPAIFFIPSNTDLSDSQIEELAEDFEIGGHTVTHPMDMKMLSDEDAFDEILVNREWLQDLTRQEIKWFCYPRGRYNDNTVEQVKKAGYTYARTTDVNCIKMWDNPLRIRTTVHAFNARKELGKKDWLDNAKELFLKAKEEGGYYHIWGHSWEVNSLELWQGLEDLFKFIYEHRDN